MNSRALVTGVAFAFVCACLAHQAEAGWRDRFDIAEVTKSNPAVQSILDGPLGLIIDVVVEIILIVLDLVLGGAYAPLNKFKQLEREVKSMRTMMGGAGQLNTGLLNNML